MSIFSSIKRSRQQAKEHSKKEAEKAQQQTEHKPYRHVPTHAGIDALNGGPPGWKQEDDREKIVEANRRRSAIIASGRDSRYSVSPGAMPGFHRVSSGLSYMSYPAAHANPTGHMPRTYSYSGVLPLPPWEERGVDVIYTEQDVPMPTLKGKELERLGMLETGQGSSGSNKVSPAGSSGDSNSSQDDLEIRPVTYRHSTTPHQSVGMVPLHQTTVSGRPAAVHRLHPSSRRTSDASDRGGDPAVMTRAAAASSMDRRPPASMQTRGYAGIPAVTLLGPMHLPEPSAAVAASSAGSTSSQQSMKPSLKSSNFGDVSSAPTTAPVSAPVSVKSTNSAPSTPITVLVEEHTWDAAGQSTQPDEASPALAPSVPHRDERRLSKSKTTRFTELETIESNIEQRSGKSAHVTPPVTAQVTDVKTATQEVTTETESETAQVAPSKGKRLSKQPGGAKVSKKHRWSMRSNSAVAV